MTTILYLGCPASERADCQRQLAGVGLSVVGTDSIASVFAELRCLSVPVLIDLSRGAPAVRHAQDVRAHFPNARVFGVADARRPHVTTDAVLAGVTDVFARPLSGRSVARAIGRSHGRYAADLSVPASLYVRSESMRRAMAIIRPASAMRAGVIIRGEDGTGRQVLARSMHATQNGNGGRFVVVDCAAGPADGVERALFGPPPGADGLECVGAGSALHQARNGTVYLRHVAELPGRVQSRLARVLRDGEAWLERTGRRIGLDIRPVAGVEPGFERAGDQHRLREDLFRTLSVIGIDMPPLRHRREDIPAIARDFLRDICAAWQLPRKTLSRPVEALLSALPWRGNANELRTLLETVARGSDASVIEVDHVLSRLRLDGASLIAGGQTLREARDRFEREYIATVLEEHQGRVSDAAQVLGLQRTNLYRKMRSLRISEDTVPR